MAHTDRTGRLTSTRKRLSAAWTADVNSIEAAILRFNDDHPLAGDCDVVFFEIGDEKLHVNVTHRRLTKEIRGWAGPADTLNGFVHNRTFGGDTSTPQLVRYVREMVFAGRV